MIRVSGLLGSGECLAPEPGDVVIQRGTNHCWVNRYATPCRMAFILIDGVDADGAKRE